MLRSPHLVEASFLSTSTPIFQKGSGTLDYPSPCKGVSSGGTMGDIIVHRCHRSSWQSTTTKYFMSRWYHTLQPLHFDQDPSKTHAFISVSENNAYTGRSQPIHTCTLHNYVPYQDYTYGYHIPPIVKEKMPLSTSAIVVNNHQHHYHSSGTNNTCICQFCLTSHSIMSRGHARLVKIL